jgi:DNA-binding FrmR family transcriptional regulator
MTEQEKEIAALKERVAHLEGVIDGISRGMVAQPRPVYPPLTQPNTGWPMWPQYPVTC